MKEFTPYIISAIAILSFIISIFSLVYKRGEKDKGLSSDIVIIRKDVSDLKDKSVIRLNNRIDSLSKDISLCVTTVNFKEFKERNEKRQDIMIEDIKELTKSVAALQALVKKAYKNDS